ncbi:hypothetical protein [Leptospira weilii]|uniref:hypothetical protein n=2 Tax=Leptospira weilii TaxID=28184 RepID=UPI002FC3BFFB
MQKYSSSQKLSQIGKSRLFKGKFQYSNFRNMFVIVFYSCVRVVNSRISTFYTKKSPIPQLILSPQKDNSFLKKYQIDFLPV